MKIDRIKEILKDYNTNNFNNINRDEETKFVYDALLNEKCISMQANGKIIKNKKNKIHIGNLQIKGRFGFVVNNEGLDHYVYNVKNNLPDDIVLVMETKGVSGKSSEAKIIGLIERKITNVLAFINGNCKLEIANNHSMRMYELKIPRNYDLKAHKNTYVVIDILKVRNFVISGVVNDFVADKNDPDIQMKLVLQEFDITSEFDKPVLEQAKQIANTEVSLTNDRVDLTNYLFFTIDGADAKDLDDAVCLIKEGENYRLFVSIADVSHYVKEDTLLDKSALSRSTSVYFVDRVVPMLPKEISNGICSLHPNVLRYTQTCEMLINSNAEVIEHKLYPSIIKSNYKMTYEDVNAMLLESDSKLITKYSEIYGILREMNKLAKQLNKKRLKRGSFNLEDKEAKFDVDDNGDIIDIRVRVRYDAEKLIEEFMIIANETVAQTIEDMDLPFIYRVHDQPAPIKLQELEKIFKLFGIELKGDFSEFHSSEFKNVLDNLEDPLEKRIVSDLIVRSLKKAIYSPKNSGHFGLASTSYTHFTSPIRRYPDLIVHRLLRKYLYNNDYNNMKYLDGKLSYIADVVSEKERKAIKAEQKIENQKKAEYMRKYIGKQMVGKIASITDFGFFVELENTQRGLVRFKQLVDFDRVENFKIKFKDKSEITIGDAINVELVAVDIVRGIVDFKPLDLKVREVKKDENNSKQQKGKTRIRNSKNTRSRNRTKGKRNKVNQSRKSKFKG